MTRTIFYFAYGSNMDPARINERIPTARRVGTGFITGWEVRERLFADIAPKPRGVVNGVVYLLTETELWALDRYEGYPTTYECRHIMVNLHDEDKSGEAGRVNALVYVLTSTARQARCRSKYPEQYRRICSRGARLNGIPDAFARPWDRVQTTFGSK